MCMDGEVLIVFDCFLIVCNGVIYGRVFLIIGCNQYLIEIIYLYFFVRQVLVCICVIFQFFYICIIFKCWICLFLVYLMVVIRKDFNYF